METPNKNKFPYKIRDNLYMTDINSLTDEYLSQNKITHIVIIDKYLELEPPKIKDPSIYQLMSLDIEDPKPSDNFLFGLSNIQRFISSNISIFVTESQTCPILPALIIAILINQNETIEKVLKTIPGNENLYEEYIKRLEKLDKYKNCPTPEFLFKCGRCRKTLFSDKDLILFHEFSAKDKYSNKRKKNGKVKTTECTSYFLESGKFGDKEELENFGKHLKLDGGDIKCSKCNLKIGEFFPKGTQCSCGSWVVPAIQIVKSKVDKCINVQE